MENNLGQLPGMIRLYEEGKKLTAEHGKMSKILGSLENWRLYTMHAFKYSKKSVQQSVRRYNKENDTELEVHDGFVKGEYIIWKRR